MIPQIEWKSVYEDSAWSLNAICSKYEIKKRDALKWLYEDVTPNKENLEKWERALKKIYGTQKIPFHPAYGYATPEQI